MIQIASLAYHWRVNRPRMWPILIGDRSYHDIAWSDETS